MGFLESARQHKVIEVDDLEPAMRLLAGSILTYVLGSGLLATEALRQVPLPEQTAALVRLFLQGVAGHHQTEISMIDKGDARNETSQRATGQ